MAPSYVSWFSRVYYISKQVFRFFLSLTIWNSTHSVHQYFDIFHSILSSGCEFNILSLSHLLSKLRGIFTFSWSNWGVIVEPGEVMLLWNFWW